MKNKYVKFENGRIVETNNDNGIFLEWDGIYYIYYGKSNRNYQHNGKTYDCFPIVTISEDLGKVEDISLFGCEGNNQSEDGYIDVDFLVEDWEDCKDFYALMNTQSTYQLVGMLLHPEGNYDQYPDLVNDYNDVCDNKDLLIEALKTKYVVEGATETFKGNAEYIFDEDGDGFYLYKFVRTLTDKE